MTDTITIVITMTDTNDCTIFNTAASTIVKAIANNAALTLKSLEQENFRNKTESDSFFARHSFTEVQGC